MSSETRVHLLAAGAYASFTAGAAALAYVVGRQAWHFNAWAQPEIWGLLWTLAFTLGGFGFYCLVCTLCSIYDLMEAIHDTRA